MIQAIIDFSIRNKLLIGVMVFGLIGVGIFAVKQLPIDAVPDITDNQVQIITTSPTLAAQEVEKFITYPLEISMGNIPEVLEIRSVSRFGLSVITVVFNENMDIYLARQLISERIKIAEGEIPEGMGQPEMGPITTGLGEIYQYIIYPDEGFEDKYSAMDLRTIQDWIVKRQLTGVKGVIEINSSGGFLKQYEVAVNPGKIRGMNITIQELFDALHRNNANTGGSYIEKKYSTYFIRGEGLLESMDEIENVVIKNVNGLPVLVRDVATVQFGNAPRFGAVTKDGKGEVVAGQVMMLKGENSAEVTRLVKDRMVQIQKSLPEGIIIEPYLDRTKLINRTTKTVITNLTEGGLIVIFVLVLLLGNLRAGLIVASVIPLSMMFAIIMMNIFGVSANLMSLGAIDFGLIVDGAVIVVEAVVHRLSSNFKDQRLSTIQMESTISSTAGGIMRSAIFGQIIILIVYLPILFLSGIEGKTFKPMAQTVSFAILGALILSITYVPMMSALFLNKSVSGRRTLADRIMATLHRMYEPILRLALRFKPIVLGGTLALFIWSALVFNRMGGEFIPTLEEGDFALHQILPPGSSIAQGVDISADLQEILTSKFPEVEKVVTKIGTAEIPTDIMPLEAGDIYVIMKPKKEWTTASTRQEMFELMEEEMNKFPGVMYEFTQPIQMRFNELMTGVRQDIAIKIYGEDLGILQKKGNESKALIESLDGVGDIQVEPVSGLQQMVVDYDRRKMAKYGLDIETLNRMVRMGFAGEQAGFIFEGERRFDLVVRLENQYRDNIDQLKNLYIPLPDGHQIPLKEVAKVEFREGPSQISRDDTKRRIVIGVNARNIDVETLVGRIQDKLDADLDLPSGYYVTYGGQFENLQRAKARLSIAVPTALGLIFFLLFLTFNSAKQSVLIFTAIPLAAIGGVWSLYFRDMPFSISAGVGFIALFGVAVLNGIVLIAQFNTLKKEGMKDVTERIMNGTSLRLRPVIMTAAVASLGFLPMAVSGTAGAEVQRPLATVVIGGLVTATFLTLIILPVLYYYFEKGIGRNSSKGVVTILLIMSLGFVPAQAQIQEPISLDKAIELAMTSSPALERDRQEIARQQTLTGATLIQGPTTIVFSGEEYNFMPNTGVFSFGLFQTFALPKANKARSAYQQHLVNVSNTQMVLTQLELKREVKKAYYELVYSKKKANLLEEQVGQYEEFEQIAQRRVDLGKSGKMPALSARTQKRMLEIQHNKAEKDQATALNYFNSWMESDTIYDTLTEELLPPTGSAVNIPTVNNHPLWIAQQQRVGLAESQIDVERIKLQPSINAGVRIQTVNGKFPFWAFQVGLNLPLFRKSTNARAEAAQLGILRQRASSQNTQMIFDREWNQSSRQLLAEEAMAKELFDEILPLAEEQLQASRDAYQGGQSTYLVYMQSMDQLLNFRLEYLETLRRYYILKADLDFYDNQ